MIEFLGFIFLGLLVVAAGTNPFVMDGVVTFYHWAKSKFSSNSNGGSSSDNEGGN